MLTDYGKQQIEKMRTESTERLFSNAETKAKDTLTAIEVNIEKYHWRWSIILNFQLL